MLLTPPSVSLTHGFARAPSVPVTPLARLWMNADRTAASGDALSHP